MAIGPNSGYFEKLAGSYAPLAGGNQYKPTYGYEGLPFSNMGGIGGMLVNMIMPQMMQAMHQRTGMMPMGLHGQNIYDAMQQQRFTRLHDDLLRQSAESDKRSMMSTWQGLANMAGTPWNAETRTAARQLTDTMGMILPTLVQSNPMLVDAMMGTRGSAGVMSQYMHLGGRYRLDPVSGQMGMSANTVKEISEFIYKTDFSPHRDVAMAAAGRNYGQGWINENLTKSDRSVGLQLHGGRVGDLRGMTAGQFGLLFDEMSRRGMIRADERSIGERTMAAVAGVDKLDPKLLSAIAMKRGLKKNAEGTFDIDMSKVSAGELDSLREDPNVQTRMRQLDARRITDQIRAYSGAISAVRDIFGDRGQPNAPMKELLAGLEAMTGGNLAQIDPGRLEMMVRNTYNLAQQTGVGLDKAMMMQNHAAAQAALLGIDPAAAISATQGNLAFGGAYRERGMNAPHLAAWGRLNAEQAQQYDLNLRMQAAASPAANQINAALRYAEARGGLGGAAGRYIAALKRGQDTFEIRPGERISTDLTRDAYYALMEQGGADKATMDMYLQATDANMEYGVQYGTGNLVRKMQPNEMRENSYDSIVGTIWSRVRNQLIEDGMDPEEASTRAREIAKKAGTRVTDAIWNASPEARTNRSARNRIIAEALLDSYKGTAAEGFDKDEQLVTAEALWGRLDRDIKKKHGKGIAASLQVQDRTTLVAAERQVMRARFASEQQRAFGNIGRGNAIARAIDAIQEGGDIQTVLGRLTGGITKKELRQAIGTGVEGVMALQGELKEIENQIMTTQDPKKLEELHKRREAVLGQLETQASQLHTMGVESGLYMETYTRGDVSAVSASLDRLTGYTKHLPEFGDETDAKKFWGGDAGRDYITATKTAMRNVDDMIFNAARNNNLAQRLGLKGIKRLETLQKKQERLRQLAATYTGGDIAKLMAGDFASEDKDAIMEEVTGIRKLQRDVTKEVGAAMDREFDPKAKMSKEVEEAQIRLRESQGTDEKAELERFRDFKSAYGYEVTAKELQDMEGTYQTGKRREFLDRAISSRKSLQDFAKEKGLNIADVLSMSEKELEDAGASREVREARRFQRRTGLSQLGAGAGLDKTQQVLEAGADKYAGRDGRGSSEEDPQKFPKELIITGNLNLENGEVNGTAKGKHDVQQP